MAILKNGYVYVWDKLRKRHNYLHRLVMEGHIGRFLTKDEQVHHIDGDKQNNSIGNLILTSSIGEHRQLHDTWGPILFFKCELCDSRHHAKGFCKKHYARKFRKNQGW